MRRCSTEVGGTVHPLAGRLSALAVIAALAAIVTACSSASTTSGAGSLPASAAGGASTSAASTAAATVTSVAPRGSTVTVTVTRPAPVARSVVPPGPTDRSSLLRALQSAVPVDPNPYEGAHPNVYFETPSHNIGCYIFDEGPNTVECNIARYDFAQPGPDCNQGALLTIDENASPAYAGCATYSLYAGATVLPYRASVRNGDLECASSSIGVTCGSTQFGTGFFLSRGRFTPIT